MAKRYLFVSETGKEFQQFLRENDIDHLIQEFHIGVEVGMMEDDHDRLFRLGADFIKWRLKKITDNYGLK